MGGLQGVDIDSVSTWLDEHVAGARGPYRFELIPAGGSNLTYRVQADRDMRFVLRRPPVTAHLATAHDMRREYRIMDALANSAVPVPAMLAYCDDVASIGAEFYCMAWVDGITIGTLDATARMSRQDCLVATESLVDAQVAFHQIDLEQVGLQDLARHTGYVERQLKRWRQQVATGSDRVVPAFERLHTALTQSVPASDRRPGLAHGDYRFDNTILTADYRMAAVLDWELCTIGDPLVDFVWSLNYWAEPGEELHWLQSPPTQNPLFPGRRYVMDMYAEKSGIPIDNLAWYNAFSWWKQACIVEGVYARLRKGAAGGMKMQSLDHIGALVDNYLLRAGKYLRQVTG
jgi:aminoglycoside phosphotransferase (APT) family kinase protein